MEQQLTEWDGKAFAPGIDPYMQVEVRFRDGSTDVHEAGAFWWEWEDEKENPRDITAYRKWPPFTLA